MNKDIFKVFNLMSQLKGFDWSKFEQEDEYYIKASYPLLKNIISFRKWNKIVREYSLTTDEDIYDSCDILQTMIYEQYKDTNFKGLIKKIRG